MSKRKKAKKKPVTRYLPFLVRRKGGGESELLLIVDHRNPDIAECLNAIARVEFRDLTDVWLVFPGGLSEAQELDIEVLVDPLCVYLHEKAREWKISLARLNAGFNVAELRSKVRRSFKVGTRMFPAAKVPQRVIAFEPTGMSKDRGSFHAH